MFQQKSSIQRRLVRQFPTWLTTTIHSSLMDEGSLPGTREGSWITTIHYYACWRNHWNETMPRQIRKGKRERYDDNEWSYKASNRSVVLYQYQTFSILKTHKCNTEICLAVKWIYLLDIYWYWLPYTCTHQTFSHQWRHTLQVAFSQNKLFI